MNTKFVACTPKHGHIHLKRSQLLHSCYYYRQSHPCRMNLPSTLPFTIIIMQILFPKFQFRCPTHYNPPDAIKLRPQMRPRHLGLHVDLLRWWVLCRRGLLDTHFTADGYRRQAESECATPFLGEFAKLRNATITSAIRPSVRPPAQMEQLGSHWTDFNEMSYFEGFFF